MQLKRKNAPAKDLENVDKLLDPEALTICFARRFATYKRATLLFREPEKLARILNNPDKPVQLIFAGKAHPADDQGKELIRKISELMKQEPFKGRIVFIEDYDINVARYMVQGADVWLNTPRRPLEACGTSGMKASANGALNLSVLDGWWDEGFLGDNGWAIGSGEEYGNPVYQDDIESKALYDLLEESVKPIFYERGEDDLPREWIRMMKRCICTICPAFNSHRMVSDYIETAYVPAHLSSEQLTADNFAKLKEMVAWKKHIAGNWSRINIKSVEIMNDREYLAGKEVEVFVTIDTVDHAPEELEVKVVHGPVDLWDQFTQYSFTKLSAQNGNEPSPGEIKFGGKLKLSHTGRYGYEVLVTPFNEYLPNSQKFDLVLRA
jgi:starch phosphorylase